MRALVFVAISLLPVSASAQAVRGIVADIRTGEPLPGAAVLLTDSAGTIRGAVSTDDTGAFYIESHTAGSHVLITSRIGFHRSESDPLPVGENRILEVQVNMVPLPSFVLDPIEVIANDQPRSTAMRGFLRRKATNVGFSFGLDDIERIAPYDLGDLLRWAPGALVQGGGRSGETWVALNFNRCRPAIVVDGRRLAPEFIDNFPMDWVVAVEVFRRRSEVPNEFRRSIQRGSLVGRDCGAVLVWTKWVR